MKEVAFSYHNSQPSRPARCGLRSRGTQTPRRTLAGTQPLMHLNCLPRTRGQFHCSRACPIPMASVCNLLPGALTPGLGLALSRLARCLKPVATLRLRGPEQLRGRLLCAASSEGAQSMQPGVGGSTLAKESASTVNGH